MGGMTEVKKYGNMDGMVSESEDGWMDEKYMVGQTDR